MASREALEDWVQRWLKANQDAEAAGDWKPLAEFYTEDATYGWNIGPKEDVMCVNKDEIRDVALGLEMEAPRYYRHCLRYHLCVRPEPYAAAHICRWRGGAGPAYKPTQ